VTLTSDEDGGGNATGTLVLIGTVRSDGTIDGTYTDSCSGVIPSITWFAERITTLPNLGDTQP